MKTCLRCRQEKPDWDFYHREIRGRAAKRTYCKECEARLAHKRYLKGDHAENKGRWQPVFKESELYRAIVENAEVRFRGHSISHQLRVFRATGRTGPPPL